MRICKACVVIALGCTLASLGALEPGLPVWHDKERAEGGGNDSLIIEAVKDTLSEPLALPPPSAGEIAAEGSASNQIPEKYWAAYFGERPRKFLLDPQGLLNAAEERERLKFLKDHASDSSVDLFIYLFKRDQEIPGEVRAEEVAERFFPTGRSAVLVYYYLGAPQRAVLYVSPSLTQTVSTNEQRRAIESAVMQAAAKQDPSAQFEAFLMQMSIRIYWMEQLQKDGISGRVQAPAVRSSTGSIKKSATKEKLLVLMTGMQRFTVPAVVGMGLMILLSLLVWYLRRKASYVFPELEVEPRLGGAHAAGVGAVISFASAAVSPASQRDQVPLDPPRR